MTAILPYEEKAQRLFGEVCVNKGLVQQAGFGTRSIPAFVSEWIITRNTPEGVLDATAQQRIRTFLNKHLPTRDQKEQLKAQLQNGETLTILDQFSVTVDLIKNEYRLSVPCLDEQRAGIERNIVEQFPLLLGSGVWGVGKLQYYPPDHVRTQGQIWMIDFRPMQNARLVLDLSRYARLVSGGKVTAAALFYNNATRQPGLLTHYDLVIFDEAQSISFNNPGEIIGVPTD